MIDKETATARGVTVLDKSTILQDNIAQRIEALKRILPNVINSDNQLNTQALQDILNIANTTSNNKGYELTFAGKGIARAMASTETTKELKTEQAQSKHFDTTGNIVLRGDNIDALKILYQNYYGKIKMIYIDPPYNTTSENFIYNDNFKQSEEALIEEYGLGEETTNFLHNVYGTKSHSGWLAFMYPRLTLARDLLTDDGVIFISIDDNEQANLKILCDEVFGEDNLVDLIVWNNKYTLQNDAKYTCSQYENILFYAKTKSLFVIGKADRTDKQNESYRNPDNDPKGSWKATPLHAKSGSNSPNSVYSVTFSNGITWSVPNGRYARFSKETLLKLESNNELYFNKNGGVDKKTYLTEVENKGVVFSNLWNYKDVGHTHGNNEELANLVGKGIFDNPKGTKLIKQICNVSNIQNNDIILDFFAGSGTTGDAVMQLNAEDGGNRKYILVQWDEAIDKKKNTEAHTFCKEHNLPPVISSICIERLSRAGEKIHKEQKEKNSLFEEQEVDIGYKVFSLTNKPCIAQDEEDMFKIDNERGSVFDTLYNMLAATCKTLDTPIVTIIADSLYQCDNELYLIAPVEQESLEEYKDRKINIDAYADIDLETFLNLGVATRENVTVVF